MMLPTHIVLGLTILTPFLPVLPTTLRIPAILGIIIGSTIPDIDLIIGYHRKTLHAPIYALLAALTCTVIATINLTPLTITATTLTIGIAQHSLSDALGGGLEHKPWQQTATKAVYSHHHNTWWQPKHFIPYDGSPHDLALYIALAALTYTTYAPYNHYLSLLTTLTIIATVYTASRRILPRIDYYLYHKFPQLQPLLETLHGSTRHYSNTTRNTNPEIHKKQ